MTTDTPRTDAFAQAKYDNSCAAASMGNAPGVSGYEESPEDAYADAVEFARTLERDLSECRAALAELVAAEDANDLLPGYAQRRMAALATARALATNKEPQS